MKAFGLTLALWVLAATYAQADSYETYAFGDSESEACKQVKSDLKDQAILKCRMNDDLLEKVMIGDCRIAESSNTRHKALGSVKFSCKTN